MAPETSSRHSAARAIMARAESFTLDGLWPSAQLIVASAVALPAAAFDQLQNAIVLFSQGAIEGMVLSGTTPAATDCPPTGPRRRASSESRRGDGSCAAFLRAARPGCLRHEQCPSPSP